jgi:uncharacterized membrane protein YeiB
VADRIVGVDVARGLALVGMMAVHVLPATTPDGDVSTAYLVASGRSAALFAVLAGVGLALARPTPAGVLARAGVITVIGLTLGVFATPVAVILVNYGLLFACTAPFLRLQARSLALLGGAWMLVTPVLGHLLRPHVAGGPGPSPSWFDLADPAALASHLLLTGYYPVLQWTGYVLVGLAVGRCRLRRSDVAVRLVVGGAVLAAAAALASAALLGPAGGYRHLLDAVPPSSPVWGQDLAVTLQTSMYGTTPTTSWWWLAVGAPHSGTPLDLLHTTGTALLVLGGALLLAARWPSLLAPLAAAGSMTLTLYTLHVLALGPLAGPTAEWSQGRVLLLHVVVAGAAAMLWRGRGWRGPLVAVATAAARAALGGAVSRAG